MNNYDATRSYLSCDVNGETQHTRWRVYFWFQNYRKRHEDPIIFVLSNNVGKGKELSLCRLWPHLTFLNEAPTQIVARMGRSQNVEDYRRAKNPGAFR